MDAAVFFLIVFLAYTVLLVVAMMRTRQMARDVERLRSDVDELRTCQLASARVISDVASDSKPSAPSSSEIEDLQALLGNPLVQSMMPKE